MALAHTVPLVAAFGLWLTTFGRDAYSGSRASVVPLVTFVREAFASVFNGFGRSLAVRGGRDTRVTWYRLKRHLRRPLTVWRRFRWRHASDVMRAMYEGNDYRTSLRRFAKASIQNPDILVDIALHDGATLFDVGAYMGEWTIPGDAAPRR